MVMINFDEMSNQTQWIVGIIVNVIFVVLTTTILYLMAIMHKIPKMEKDECHHFIFGYIGNMIVFLYTYQYSMQIERFVSVFSLILILIFAYKYLVSKQITFKEILLFGIVFGIYDYIIIIFTGNTLFSESSTFTQTESIIFQICYLILILFSIGYFAYKLYKNHHWNPLRYILVGFITIFLLVIYINDRLEELFMTFLILALFTWLIEIILKFIHKEFKILDYVFYARILMITMVIAFMHEMNIFSFPDFELGQMGWIIGFFYVSSFSDILTHVSPKKTNITHLNLNIDEYLKHIYKSITSRYKDILVFSNTDKMTIHLKGLARNIIYKNEGDINDNIDLSSVSLIIIYTNDISFVQKMIKKYPTINKSVISKNQIKSDIFTSCFSDYQHYIYTI
jgi:hypothetical protein